MFSTLKIAMHIREKLVCVATLGKRMKDLGELGDHEMILRRIGQ